MTYMYINTCTYIQHNDGKMTLQINALHYIIQHTPQHTLQRMIRHDHRDDNGIKAEKIFSLNNPEP